MMKMVAEYLEHALRFEKLAAEETDPALKDALTQQAEAYRRLAAKRAGGRTCSARKTARLPTEVVPLV